MPPKAKKASGADRSKDVQETEDPLQAVVLTDSYERAFAPFTDGRPRCLLPLVGTPLIEYALEFLANSGVEEVYIYCGAHADQIEAYLRGSKWTSPSAPFLVEFLRSTSRSVGDAMRDLDKRAILTNDFLVVYGDVVADISIEPAMLEHRQRRTADKNAIMTMVLREGNTNTHKGAGVSPVFVVDPSRKRCLQYNQIDDSGRHSDRGVLLDEDVLLQSGADEIDVRHDLIDCGIDICTPDVLALWSDNFDYEWPRRGFLHAVLKDYELNGKTIHTFIETEGYANRVRDLRSYQRVARDILCQKTGPFAPNGVFCEEQHSRLHNGDTYRADGVVVDKSAIVRRHTAVGMGTKVGARTIIRGATIGRNCTIGDDCTLEGAYIWDDVTIRNGTRIEKAVVAEGATVGRNCHIAAGTLISSGADISDGTTTTFRQKIGLGSKDVARTASNASNRDLDSDEDGFPGLVSTTRGRSLSASSISTLTSSRSASQEPHAHMRSESMSSETSESGHAAFHADAVASIYDSLLRGDDPANINLELQAQRLALNASEHAVRRAVTTALVRYVVHKRQEQKTGQGNGSKVSEILEHNGDLVRRVVFDAQLEEKPDQVDLLLLVQRELLETAEAEIVMLSLCNGLYAEDLVQGEALVQWWGDARSIETDGLKAVRSHKQMQQLIDIAGEDEEEEDESEDEDENEDDSDA